MGTTNIKEVINNEWSEYKNMFFNNPQKRRFEELLYNEFIKNKKINIYNKTVTSILTQEEIKEIYKTYALITIEKVLMEHMGNANYRKKYKYVYDIYNKEINKLISKMNKLENYIYIGYAESGVCSEELKEKIYSLLSIKVMENDQK